MSKEENLFGGEVIFCWPLKIVEFPHFMIFGDARTRRRGKITAITQSSPVIVGNLFISKSKQCKPKYDKQNNNRTATTSQQQQQHQIVAK